MRDISTARERGWFVVNRPNPSASVRLFCFPHSGGAASVFHAWPDELPSSFEMLAVQLPGRGTRLAEPLHTRMSPLIAAITGAVSPYLDRPFAFFGHSLGALLSFELARALRREGAPQPARLFVAGHNAPPMPDPGPPMHTLSDDALVEKLRELNGTPEEVLEHPELKALLFPILRADFEVGETYHYQDEPPLECPISAYGGLRDKYVTRDRLEDWREQTAGSFALRMFPGDHFFPATDRQLLLQALARDLAQVVGLGPS